MTSEKSKMSRGGKRWKNTNQEIKKLQDSKHELHNWVNDLHNQIDMKDQLIQAFELKLIQKEKQIENVVHATYATNNLIQKVDAICDTKDLIQKFDATCDTKNLISMVNATCDIHDSMVVTKATQDMDDDSLTSYEMKSYSKLMNGSLVED
jgi:hypothetical protein